MPIAITRQVSPAMNQCLLTHLSRQPINLPLARRQHQAYQQALARQGLSVITLPSTPELPDAVFVEDTALVLDEIAVITRPGATSRRPETTAVAAALADYRPLAAIQPPATLDGGDVLVLGRRVYVGQGNRSNAAALTQLQTILAPWGYTVQGVPVQHCLHLKSAVTQVATDCLLLNPDWIDASLFPDWQIITVHPREPFAANALWLNPSLIFPLNYPRTAERLTAQGAGLIALDMSEFIKAEGGVTCCSLIFAA